MIEDFLQRKIADLVDQYIEFEKLKLVTAEGMTIKNSKIKPKLAELISQALKIPLELTSGSIASLTLNRPWEKLFFFLNSPVRVAVEGVHIRTKLPNFVKEDYLLKKKQNLIERLTEGLFNPLEAILHHQHSFINKKLKEYLLSTIILEAKNICLEIEVDLKQRVSLILRIDSLTFRKEEKKVNESERIHLQVQGVGLYYRASGQEVEFVSPTKVEFERTKSEVCGEKKRSSVKKLNIDKLQLNVNNLNYGDIARIVYLVKWHNSFDILPFDIWKIKPFILNECRPKHKFLYCAHLIKHSIQEQNYSKQLTLRRQYLNFYEQVLANTATPENKERLKEIEKHMPIWRIVAYRNFCINIYKDKLIAKKQKRKAEEPQPNVGERLIGASWFKSWSASETNKEQLEEEFLKKINTIDFLPDDIQSVIELSVGKFKAKLSIVTQHAVEPFILLVGTDCSLRHTALLLEKTWEVQLEVIRCKIQYEKYLGHCERYRNFISECKEHLNVSEVLESSNQGSEDEFDEIGKFLEVSFRHNSRIIAVNLLPFDIFINHDVVEKFSILLNIENLSKLSKMDKLEENYLDSTNPWQIVEDEKEKIINLKRSQNEDSTKNAENSKENKESEQSEEQSHVASKQKEIYIKTTFNVIVPMDLRSNNSPELVVQVAQIVFHRNQTAKAIDLKGVLVKYKLPQKPEEEDEGYKNLVNFLAPRVEQRVIVRKFNVKVELEKHLSFDKSSIIIDAINIEVPPQDFIFSLIQLIYLHAPKSKEHKIKQYYRKKQSIGEEFIDACENLKEHITKSMIISSEKLSKKSVVREKRSKQLKIVLKGVSVTQRDFQLLVGEMVADYNEIGIEQQSLSSHNHKQLKLTVHNARRLIDTLRNVTLQITKESIKRGPGSEKSKNSSLSDLSVEIFEVNLQVVVALKHIKSKNAPSLKLDASRASFDKNAEIGTKEMQASVSLCYDEEVANSERFTQIPFLQPCQLYYRQTDEFNLNKKTLHIDAVNINIKPSLFKFMARALKDYYLDEEAKCTITNGTINTIRIKKSQQNYYADYKHGQKFTTDNYYCELWLFGNKVQLEFNQHSEDIPKQKIQCIEIGENNSIINREVAPNHYVLESNIRILNHQDKTLWLKITENSSSIIKQSYEETRFRLQQLSFTPKRSFQVDLTQRVELEEEPMRRSSYFKTISSHNSPIERSKSSGKTFNIALKPKEKVHLLIDSNDHKFMQIYDQGVNFTELSMNELFEESELVLQSEEEDEPQYLVIRSEISSEAGIEGLIYTFHIYSPIYIVNKTPWELEYRLSQEQASIEENEDRRISRRRSFELVPLKKIDVLSSQKIRSLHYNQIQLVKLQLNKCEREIPSLLSLISSIKEKNGVSSTQFCSQTMLITLRNNRKEMQLILKLEFSANILKIKIYPQFIIVNMSKEIITFKIKEDQITYPQITLSNLNLDFKDCEEKAQKERRSRFLSHINEYINLSDEKLKERDALKQLFQNFQENLEIFTGKIEQNEGEKGDKAKIKRKLIYNVSSEPQKPHQLRMLGKSSKGYVSDYGSDGQFREELLNFTEQPLEDEHILIYSEERYMFYKRVLRIEGYFSLIIISPTVHIINKSQAVFFAKSSCDHLVKINKNSHNYVHISQEAIDLQASFEEEISLNEWIKLDLNHLGTIYYSKDMIQHHGSGYESKQYTLRKRRMKKTPKIFYKILLCKYERGQKILIQQSQYPPYSFINNTNFKIKIQEPEEHFIEQFVEKGDMGQYAPRNPYHSPKFRLYVGQKYEYKRLLEFKVDKKQTFQLQKGIIVSVEQYKDKTIVQIKERSNENVNLAMSTFEKSQRYQYNTLLEEIAKFTIEIETMNIAVLNQWNRELNSNFIQKLVMVYEKKNYKDYYKLHVSNIEGYDYMDTEPTFIYKRKKKEKKRLGILQREIQEQVEHFCSFELIINYHKNALIIERCSIKLDEIVFYLSADLILAYVKNYYHPIYDLLKVNHYYIGHQESKKSGFATKTFIFESLDWSGTSLKIETRNLFIMETFLNKQYEKWLVKFINWLGDIKPISIEPMKLTYEQITIWKLKKHINFQKKLFEVAKKMMDYPISQFKEIFLFLTGEQNKSIREKFNLLYNLAKSLQYIVDFTLSLNENLKSKLKTYNETFSEAQKENFDIISKMINFEYCQWKYRKDRISNKLKQKIKRLERYNTRDMIIEYDDFKAKIKLAIDSHLSNKLYKKIERVFRINSDFIFALVHQFAIIYKLSQNEWTVLKIELIVGFHIENEELDIHYWKEQEQEEKEYLGNEKKHSNIRKNSFKDVELSEEAITQIKRTLNENKLAYYY